MIPKIIHYCWFSNDRKPKQIQHCIDSWKRVMPDYQIKCWDGDSFDFDGIAFVRQAMSVKQYAAAADYVRLYALYNEGGIYLDSDVEVYHSFDNLITNRFFTGTEVYYNNYQMAYDIEAAIIGSEKGHPFLKDCMDYFEMHDFIHPDGTFDNKYLTLPMLMAQKAEKYGYKPINRLQNLNEGIIVFPADVFPNTMCGDMYLNANTLAKHCNASSWCPMEDKGAFFHFCRRHNMIDFYRNLEQLRVKATSLFKK